MVIKSESAELISGLSYQVIKPEKQDDDTLVLNPKFKPARTTKLHLTDKNQIVKEIEEKIQPENVTEDKSKETFENIASKPANTKISKMAIRCLSTSRIITSPYGEYRIEN